MISRRRALGLVAAPFLLRAGGTARADDGNTITIATSPYGGIYYPLGNSICRLFNLAATESGPVCVASDSKGSVENIRALRAGTVQFALAQSDIVTHALTGKGDFAGDAPADDLRALLLGHAETFTLLTRPGSAIDDVTDLPGHRLATGPMGSGQKVTAAIMLNAFGWQDADFGGLPAMTRDEEVAALCDGKADAVTLYFGHPNGDVQEAIERCNAHIVPVTGRQIDEIVAAHAEYFSTTIPGGIYENHPDPIPTFGSQSVLVTSISADDEMVNALLAAVFDNVDILKRLHPAFAGFTPETMVPRESWARLHPAAQAFFTKRKLLIGP
jgi:TRAP transporter TAXI family solute receptor